MKRLTVGVHKSAEGELLSELSWLSCLEVVPVDKYTAEGAGELEIPTNSAAITECETRLEELSSAISLCEKYDRTKKKLLAPQTYLSRSQFEDGENTDITREICRRAREISETLSSLRLTLTECDTALAALRPYLSYDLPLCENRTKTCDITLGSIENSADFDEAKKRLSEECDGAYVCDIGECDERHYFALFSVFSQTENAIGFLSEYGFIRNSFANEELTALKKNDELELRRANAAGDLSMAEKRAEGFAKDNIVILKNAYDIFSAKLSIEQLKAKLPNTQSTVLIEGWYPADKEAKLFSLLEKYHCCYETREALQDEQDVPVLLKNSKATTPFESVISLYSLPSYHGFDATAVMSIFYFVTFGLMFADVVYGLILMIAGFLGPKILKSKKSTADFLHLFGICGISCTVAGICFNGYMGDLPEKIATNWFGVENFPELALLFSPLKNPMPFLVIGLAIGFIQVLFGMGISGYMQIKRGKVLDAIFDVGSWYLLIFGLLGLAAGSLIKGAPEALGEISKWLAIAGVAALILTQGRAEKNIVMKLFKGVASLYSLVGILSDVLSYSRILALGLASSVIASVANLLATMSGLTVPGIILFVIALCLGHALNFALNVLGTYVHTSRLQYIEFFGRFYEDGGRPFAPINVQTKYNGIEY